MDTIVAEPGRLSSGLVELIGERVRRRRRAWSEDEKKRIVEETLQPGASVSTVARRHDINANLLFTWRRADGSAIEQHSRSRRQRVDDQRTSKRPGR